MKILVTGCAGFIGFHLTKRLLSEGHEIIGVDNLNDYYPVSLKIARLRLLGIDGDDFARNKITTGRKGKFGFIKADIADKELYDNVLNGMKFDYVCHLAAQAGVRYSIDNPQLYISSNIQGFFNILEYCRHNPVQRLVFASSSSIYGKNLKIPYCESDTADTPISLYAATKKSNELFAHCYSELYGITAIGLRFFTVYGPWGRPDMAPYLFTKAILEGEPVKVFNQGDMLRDFTYVDDIVEGICKVLLDEPAESPEAKEKFRIYNIGNSKPVNIDDFISLIEKISGNRAQKILLPMQQGDVKATWADTSLLKRDYGYQPRTSVETGLTEFIKWYKEYYA